MEYKEYLLREKVYLMCYISLKTENYINGYINGGGLWGYVYFSKNEWHLYSFFYKQKYKLDDFFKDEIVVRAYFYQTRKTILDFALKVAYHMDKSLNHQKELEDYGFIPNRKILFEDFYEVHKEDVEFKAINALLSGYRIAWYPSSKLLEEDEPVYKYYTHPAKETILMIENKEPTDRIFSMVTPFIKSLISGEVEYVNP